MLPINRGGGLANKRGMNLSGNRRGSRSQLGDATHRPTSFQTPATGPSQPAVVNLEKTRSSTM